MLALCITALSLALPGSAPAQQQGPIQLCVDLTDAPRHLIHVTELLPAHSGLNTYSYPQWIPGQHLPGGPIDNLTGLVFRAGSPTGPIVPWRRDLVDLYAFHVTPPPGATSLAVAFDILEVPSRANTIGTNRTSSHVTMLEPSDVVLYPSDIPARYIPITATIHLPSTWSAATALRSTTSDAPALNGPDTTFRTVSLEQLVDSPILVGDHCRQYPLAPEIHPSHTLDICAEKPADLDLQPALLASMSTLVRQANALFRSHHYDHYDFLVALSPHLEGDSIEHTQSADYVVKSLDFSNPNNANFLSIVLPHEFTHSWCGKYRRPYDLATPDFHTPMQDDLLWVYEGLTEYYGDVLAARAGFRTPTQVLDRFDQAVYQVDQPGRLWRPVQDTADASSILRGSDTAWSSWRLTQDYYHEGALLWLEADTKIRQLTHGQKSLDDFAALFLGANPAGHLGDTGPGVFTYTFNDLVQALNTITPYDWAHFWTTKLNALTPKPPTAGLEAAGYTYADGGAMVPDEAAFMKATHMAEMYHSLGIFVLPDGTLRDVWMNSPAYKAGLGPGDKLTAINGQPYSSDALVQVVSDSKTTKNPIVLTAVRDGETATYNLEYHGGGKYAVLQRNANPDLLTTTILQPRP
jgi:predicted metalloprotease with PDZ domain